MRVVTRTPELYYMARRRLDYLDSLLPSTRVQVTRQLDRDIAFATVELLNTWARFSRSLYFSVCRGARDALDAAITTTSAVRQFEDAQLAASQPFRRHPLTRGRITHREEPNWLDPTVLQKCLGIVGASNLTVVNAALSLSTRVFADLPSLRNFYGHRGKDTALKASRIGRSYGHSAGLHPTELCVAYAPGRPQSILRDWTADLRTIMRVAAA